MAAQPSCTMPLYYAIVPKREKIEEDLMGMEAILELCWVKSHSGIKGTIIRPVATWGPLATCADPSGLGISCVAE